MIHIHYAHHKDPIGTNSHYPVIHAAMSNHIMTLFLKNVVYVHLNKLLIR